MSEPQRTRAYNRAHDKTYDEVCGLDGCTESFTTTTSARRKYCSMRHKWAAIRQRAKRPPSEEEDPILRLPGHVPDDVLVHESLFSREEERQVVLEVEDVQEGERAVYLFDLQIPFHDTVLLSAIHRFMSDFKPNRVFYGGDIGDMYNVSVFDKNPTRRFNLEDEVKSVRSLLDFHRSLVPDATFYWIDGNHEYRLIRELIKAGGQFYSLRDEDTGDPTISVPSVYGLRKRGIEYVPFPGRIDYAGFVVTHGPSDRRNVGNIRHAAKLMLERIKSSGCCGDFHRSQFYGSVGDWGQTQGWYCVGCLCRLDPPYAPFPEWNQGFLYSTVVKERVHPSLVTVFDKAFCADGKTYRY